MCVRYGHGTLRPSLPWRITVRVSSSQVRYSVRHHSKCSGDPIGYPLMLIATGGSASSAGGGLGASFVAATLGSGGTSLGFDTSPAGSDHRRLPRTLSAMKATQASVSRRSPPGRPRYSASCSTHHAYLRSYIRLMSSGVAVIRSTSLLDSNVMRTFSLAQSTQYWGEAAIAERGPNPVRASATAREWSPLQFDRSSKAKAVPALSGRSFPCPHW